MGGSRVFVEGHNNFSENDLVSIHPHSGNWHFFNGKYDATFDVILLLTGQKDYELYGSALVIVNAFSPNFNIWFLWFIDGYFYERQVRSKFEAGCWKMDCGWVEIVVFGKECGRVILAHQYWFHGPCSRQHFAPTDFWWSGLVGRFGVLWCDLHRCDSRGEPETAKLNVERFTGCLKERVRKYL